MVNENPIIIALGENIQHGYFLPQGIVKETNEVYLEGKIHTAYGMAMDLLSLPLLVLFIRSL